MRIGIFGLAGVGKSFLVTNFVAKNEQYIATKASQIIAQAKHSVELHQLTVDVIQQNQQILIAGFFDFCQQHTDKHIIIELHTLIETPAGSTEIKSDIIGALNLDAACFIYLQPKQLLSQRAKDNNRKRNEISVEALCVLQNQALGRFTHICRSYGIKRLTLPDNNIENFSFKLRALVQIGL